LLTVIYGQIFPPTTRETYQERASLTPDANTAFREFSGEVFTEGALSEKTKQRMAIATGHVTQCPYCIRGHAGTAQDAGTTHEGVMEAIWVAEALRADSTHMHADHAFEELSEEDRTTMVPDTSDTFRTSTDQIFDGGTLSERTKRLLAVIVAHAIQCESCISDRADYARDVGAIGEKLMGATWVAVGIQVSVAYAHATVALDEMENSDS